MGREIIDLSGQRFGLWTVLQLAGTRPSKEKLWLVRCDCGKEKTVGTGSLRSGNSTCIDNDGDYEPGNVRWATRTEQARNRRSNHRLTFQGQTLCLAEWAERIGIPQRALIHRQRRGWTVERMLTTPLRVWA